MNELLENLNEQQLEAVTHTSGPLMVIAGAGTGKTTVITKRIAWLIQEQSVDPESILALTFTDKAASEMEERIDTLLPLGYVDISISTFHAFCDRVLKKYGAHIGLSRSTITLTQTELALLMRRNFDRFNLQYYRPKGNPMRFLPDLLSHFSKLKDDLVTPQRYKEFADSLPSETEEQQSEQARIQELANAYATYQAVLQENDSMDFGDLLFYVYELLTTRPAIQAELQETYQYILVDEFQDTNRIQYELVKLLLNKSQNITIVGDDDQSIYRFRGASIENILTFKDDFPTAKMVVLTQNYRSGAEILDVAYTAIQHNNPERLEAKHGMNKELQAQTTGATVSHLSGLTEDDEIEEIIKTIGKLRKDGADWKQFAVLVRSNTGAESIIAAFERAQIPFRYNAQTGLYTKPLIMQALAWMKWVDMPHDGPALYSILSHPTLGISAMDIATLNLKAKQDSCLLMDVLERANSEEGISDATKQHVQELLETLSKLQEQAKTRPVSELFMEVMKLSGLLGTIRLLNEGEQELQFGYLNQFYKRLTNFEAANSDSTLHHFLLELEHERAAGELGQIGGETDSTADEVSLMTIHASKGLEFDYVFLPQLIEQRFPSQNRSDTIPVPEELASNKTTKEHHIAEERRLFYVACTRAKQHLYLCSASFYGGGKRKRKPSRFIEESGLELSEESIGTAKPTEIKQTTAVPSERELNTAIKGSMSFTQIAAYTTCPLQYKFAHILHVPVYGKHVFSYGKSMHGTLQRMTERLHETGSVPSTLEIDQIVEEEWISAWYPTAELQTEYKTKGLESLHAVAADWRISQPPVLAVEKGFSLAIAGVTFKGRIDRIDEHDDSIEIVDYKTGKPKTKLSFDDKRQLLLYTLAAQQSLKLSKPITKLTFHYLEDNSIISFEPKQKDLDKLIALIGDTIEHIKTGNFDAKPGMHCNYCDFKDICEFSAA